MYDDVMNTPILLYFNGRIMTLYNTVLYALRMHHYYCEFAVVEKYAIKYYVQYHPNEKNRRAAFYPSLSLSKSQPRGRTTCSPGMQDEGTDDKVDR
eukprot:scaffold26305_cov228-Skeletonema_dohrnii-CCMP3373.AAC.3